MKSIKTYLMILTIFIILIAGCTSQNPTTNTVSNPTINTENLRIAEIALPGMFCQFCAEGAKNILENTEGVVGVEIDFNTKSGIVIYDSSILPTEQLLETDALQWYDGKILNDQKYSS